MTSTTSTITRRLRRAALAVAAFAIALVGLTAMPANVSAANSICTQPGVSDEIRRANGCPDTGDTSGQFENTIIGILNGVVGSLTVVAVIFIVVGGVNYMTSNGDAGKVQKAKSTILYAVIGLTICVLAFAIVNFVVANILNNGGGEGEGEGGYITSSVIS